MSDRGWVLGDGKVGVCGRCQDITKGRGETAGRSCAGEGELGLCS